MTAFVFIGPTLRSQEVLAVIPDAVCLPPVAQGDIYRATRRRPRAVGIIDGYFSGAPSVWHKEILWALSQGVPVFGSASMGALRAAELHAFGMRGVGKIFEAYRDGALEDDDEVAVVHGPSDMGFIAASEPMVNIRATLAQAAAVGVISAATRSRMEAAAKSLFFAHRTWPMVLKTSAGNDVAGAEIAAFEEWLPDGAVDQKREDALAMLAAMNGPPTAGQHTSAEFRFERTHFWDELVERAAGDETANDAGAGVLEGVLDEVRLLGPDAYRAAVKNALARLLAERESSRRGFTPPTDATAAVTSEHRTDLGLYQRSQLDTWMAENGLDQRSYDRLMEQEALLRQFAEASTAVLAQYLYDELRMSDQFQKLAARARDKADRVGKGTAIHSAELPNAVQLRAWYFEDCLGVAIPEDIHSVAASLGYEHAEHFYDVLRREWLYSQLSSGGLRNSNDDRGDGPLI